MSPIRRYLVAGVSTIVLLLALAPTAVSTQAQHKPLPDLLPTFAALHGEPYALIGNPVSARWDGTTKNAGKGAAGPSLTAVFLVHGETSHYLFSSTIGALKSGKTTRTDAASERNLFAKPGGYHVLVCADARHKVKESNEQNNCKYMRDPRNFYVGYEAWTGLIRGSSSGVSPYGAEHWESDDSTFRFTHYEDPGMFEYNSWTGSVDYNVHGTGDDGCAYDGHSVTSAGDGSIGLNYAKEEYRGFASLDAGYVTIQGNCNGSIDYFEQNQGFNFFDTCGAECFAQDLKFGMRTLSGNVNDEQGAAYSWTLVGTKD